MTNERILPLKFGNAHYVLPALILFSLAGAIILLAATAQGIGLSPDSASYIGAARNLLHGHGLSVPFGNPQNRAMTHFAPLFPVALACLGKFGIDPLEAARWLNALLFGLNILLVGLMLRSYAPASFWTPILGSFLMLTSVIVLWVHSWAWSEPLFIFLGLSGLWLLARHLEHPKPPLLFGSSALIALAWLARYPGVALAAAGLVGILLLSRETTRVKFHDCAIFLGVSLVPISLWMLRNFSVAGSATNRRLAFHSIDTANFMLGLRSISAWMLPRGTSALFGGVMLISLLLCLTIAGAVVWAEEERQAREFSGHVRSLPFLLAIFVLTYGATIIFSMLFLDANITLDNRILAPVHICVIVILLCWGHRLIGGADRNSIGTAACVACAFFAAVYAGRAAYAFAHTRKHGLGYSSAAWQNSAMMREIRSLPPSLTIFTNAPAAVYSVAGRASLPVPAKADLYTLRVNENYGDELVEMRRQLATGAALLAYFNSSSWHLPSEDELREQLRLQPVRTFPEGAFYTATY